MNIASLTIQMAADVAKLRADMDSAKGVVGDAMQQIERATALATKALGALGVSMSVMAFKNMIVDTIEATAKFHDLATTAGVSASKLQALSGVAKLSGVSADDMASAMNKLNMQLIKQGEEGRGASAALRAIGIDYEGFMALSPDQRMEMVAKSMANYKDGSEKSAVAMALFGKSGAALVPVLKDMAAMGELQAKATDEQIAMADEFSDNLVKLKVSGDGWKKELAMGMLPALNDAGKATLDVINQSGGLRDEIKKLAADGSIERWTNMAVTGFTYLLDAGSYVMKMLRTIGEFLGATAAEAVQLFGGMGEAVQLFVQGEYAKSLEAMKGAIRGTQAVEAEFHSTVTAMWSEPTVGQKIRERMAEQQRLREEHKRLGDQVEGDKPRIDTSKLNQDNAEATKKARDELEKLQKAGADLLLQSTFKLQAMQQETDQQKPLTEGQKLLIKVNEDLAQRKIVLTDAQYQGIKAIAAGMDAAKAEADQLKALAKANEEAGKAQEKFYDDLVKRTAKLVEDNQALAATNATMLTGVDVTHQLEAAKLRDQAVTMERMAINEQDRNLNFALAEAYRAQAQALRERADLVEQGVAIKEAKAAQAEWQKTIDSINDGLTGALMRAFESGKGFFQAFRDTLVNAFKSLVLQPTIKAILAPVGGAIGSLFGVPNAMAGTGADAGGSLMGSLSSLMSGGMNVLSGAAGSMMGLNIVNSSLGQALGLSSVQNIGGNMIAGPTGLGSLVGSGLGMLGNGVMGYGISKALSGGYSAGSWVNGLAGIASAIPGIGPIAGVVGGLVNRAFGMKAKEMKDYGIEGSMSGGTATGQSYQDWFQKGGWFRSDKTGTNYSALGDDIRAALDLGAKGILDQTRAYAQALKLPADALSSVTANFKVKLSDDQKANQAAMELIFQGYSDALTRQFSASLVPFQKAGETLSDTMSRLAGLATFSDNINNLGGIFSRLASSSIGARENVIALAGGIDALMTKAGRFVADYYSQAEQAGMQATSVQKRLSSLGLSGDALASRDDFRRLVESVDVSTEQGQKQLVALLDIAPQFAQLADYLAKQGLTLQDAAKAAPQVAALKDLLDPAVATAQAVDNLGSLTEQGNQLLSRIVDSINSGNASIANGLQVLATLNTRIADAQARANAIADQTAKSINTLAGNASLSSSAPTYTYDIGARDVP